MPLESIHPSPDGRFLITKNGCPFFWLADTAWELFHRLNLVEAEKYLETRQQQGFNVIQAVVLAELDGLHTPNANGHVPLLGDDPTRPNEFYFRFVDDVIRLAADKGLYIGLLPTWGDKVNGELWGTGPVIFNPDCARIYGQFLGKRYRNDTNILWILGGDRPAAGYEALWDAMAVGIQAGLGNKPFITYHPSGGGSSSARMHAASWLDMNMLQSGHGLQDAPNWEMISVDYSRTPIKPVIDGEPNYEDHPVDPYRREWQAENGRFTDYDVRKQAYRSMFSGACGHTYGHHSIWQFWTLQREPVNHPMPSWEEAMLRPGASQMVHLKRLMLSRPYFSRVPAQEILVGEPTPPPPGNLEHHNPVRAAHPRATRAADGTYAMVYMPQAEQTVTLDTSMFSNRVKAWWFDPRNGRAHLIGECDPASIRTFISPLAGPDWVLVLDDALEGFSPPGGLTVWA